MVKFLKVCSAGGMFFVGCRHKQPVRGCGWRAPVYMRLVTVVAFGSGPNTGYRGCLRCARSKRSGALFACTAAHTGRQRERACCRSPCVAPLPAAGALCGMQPSVTANQTFSRRWNVCDALSCDCGPGSGGKGVESAAAAAAAALPHPPPPTRPLCGKPGPSTDAQTPACFPPPMQAQKVVIILAGRYAGKKAVIVKNYDSGTGSRRYGHALVCGLSKEPRKVSPCRQGARLSSGPSCHMDFAHGGRVRARPPRPRPQLLSRKQAWLHSRQSAVRARACSQPSAGWVAEGFRMQSWQSLSLVRHHTGRPLVCVRAGGQAQQPEEAGQAQQPEDLCEGRQLQPHHAHALRAGRGPAARHHAGGPGERQQEGGGAEGGRQPRRQVGRPCSSAGSGDGHRGVHACMSGVRRPG